MELAIANLSLFYRQILKRIITCSLPNGLTLVIGLEMKPVFKSFHTFIFRISIIYEISEPDSVRASKSTAGLHELDLLLTLFIYAAVNSEEKENVIGHIQAEFNFALTYLIFFVFEKLRIVFELFGSN